MNCDQAFDCLTDRQQRDSIELIEHLGECPRCRDLAEMLEPAVDLLADVADDGFESSLSDGPYKDAGNGETVEPGVYSKPVQDQATSQTAPRPWMNRPQIQSARHRDSIRIAVFLLCIAVLSAAMVNVGRYDQDSTIAISLPEDCQRAEPTAASADNVVTGCVACHLRLDSLAAMPAVRREHAQQLVQACVKCHMNMTASEIHLADLASGEPAMLDGEESPIQMASCLFARSEG